MLGYKNVSEDDERLLEQSEHMIKINSLMPLYEEWHSFFDAWIIACVENKDIVFNWRE